MESSLRSGKASEPKAIPELLRLLGAGAAGSILLGLQEGQLRTNELATRVPGFAPRTVYRYVGRLIEVGAIEREEELGVPSKVFHRLTRPCGEELAALVDAYSQAALDVLPGGAVVPHSWGSLTRLAELWDSGMFHALATQPCTATELARMEHGLSFHQVARRISLLLIGGLIRERDDGRKRRRYELTEEARQASALIAGLGLWRERYLLEAGESGLTLAETAELLRAVLPLVMLPGHGGKTLELVIGSRSAGNGGAGEVVWATVSTDGGVVCCSRQIDQVDARARGEVADWTGMLAQETAGTLRISGDKPLMEALFQGLHEALWTRIPKSTPC